MKRAAELLTFLALSAAVHAGVVATVEPLGGAAGRGDGGSSRVTLMPATAEASALVERWTTAPQALSVPPTAPDAPASDQVPDQISLEAAVSTPSGPPELTPPLAEARPEAQTRPPSRTARPDLALALVAPTAPPLPGADARPPAAETAPAAPSQTASPLIAPAFAPDPAMDTTPPPPPRSTGLATDRSPRPSLRPDRPAPPRQVDTPPPPQAPTAPRDQPDRLAAGQGSGQQQGASDRPAAATTPALSAAERNSLISQWGAQILARIERARPRVEGAGQVLLSMRLSRSGQLLGLSVTRSSGDPALDQAAMSAVQRAGRFPAAPSGLTDASYDFALPVRFR